MKIRAAVLSMSVAAGLLAGQGVASAFSGDVTFYLPGLGACGKVNLPTQFVAALPASMFDPSPGGNPNNNPNCGRKIRVRYGSRSVVVTVVDRCEGCKSGDLDISPTAFLTLAPLSAGRIKATWNFIS